MRCPSSAHVRRGERKKPSLPSIRRCDRDRNKSSESERKQINRLVAQRVSRRLRSLGKVIAIAARSIVTCSEPVKKQRDRRRLHPRCGAETSSKQRNCASTWFSTASTIVPRSYCT